MTENYPELWAVAQKIEGLVNRLGCHAGGIIFVDEPFINSTALMKTPEGITITAYDLHDCEKCSLIKYDALSVEAADKIHTCIDLLVEHGYVEEKPTLRETYENVVGVYNLERNAEDMWKMVWEHQIASLFQMEQQSGIQGIALLHPTSVDDLATLNSVIRLMAQERGGELPLNKLARFKENPKLWDKEMIEWGLNDEERELMHKNLDTSYGICEAQEGFMQLVQLPACGGFDLTWSDRLRKSVAKKQPADFLKLEKEYFDNMKEKGLSEALCNYVWKVLVAYSRGYGFNKSHTLAYSIIALQEMNLAYRYPIIFWNCACLINDCGGDGSGEGVAEQENNEEQNYTNDFNMFNTNEDEEEDDEDDDEEEVKTKKKKKTAINYGKIAAGIGKMMAAGIKVSLPDINVSRFTFVPDVERNEIKCGLNGIAKINDDLIEVIFANRPYESMQDFLNKVKVTKPQMVNLIKSGCFDSFGDRIEIMHQYIESIADTKKRLTIQNAQMLFMKKLIPEEFELERKIFFFTKYIRKCKIDIYYELDERAMTFFEQLFSIDLLVNKDDRTFIPQATWDKIYQNYMAKVKQYIQKNHDELLATLNNSQIQEMWDKYCKGTLSKWEMDSISFYFHEHELSCVDNERYGFVNFEELDEQPEIDKIIVIKGHDVPLFKINRIIGTVIDKNKTKGTVTLLTTGGVVTVHIFGPVFGFYDKQLSVRGEDGKKKVIEKSCFSRGNKIIVTGIRRGDSFYGKKYAKTPYHLVENIINIDDGELIITNRRDEE